MYAGRPVDIVLNELRLSPVSFYTHIGTICHNNTLYLIVAAFLSFLCDQKKFNEKNWQIRSRSY